MLFLWIADLSNFDLVESEKAALALFAVLVVVVLVGRRSILMRLGTWEKRGRLWSFLPL